MINRTRTLSYDYRFKIFVVLVSLSILSFGYYIYAIYATASNVAARQESERQIAKISTNLDALEFGYIELKNNITMELAYEYGFKEVKSPLFIPRTRSTSLTFNTLDR